MNKSNKFSPEVRERTVRMVQEHQGESPSLHTPTTLLACGHAVMQEAPDAVLAVLLGALRPAARAA